MWMTDVNGSRATLGPVFTLALALLLIVAPVLARLPFATGFDSVTFVGGAWVGATLLTVSIVLFAASLQPALAQARSLATLVLALFASIASAAILAPAVSDHPFVVVYVYAPVLFVVVSLLTPGGPSIAFAWLKSGTPSKGMVFALALLVPASIGALVLYFAVAQPDLTHQPLMRSGFDGVWLIGIGLGIAALNAAVEEAIYRGVLFDALERSLRAPLIVVLIQAVAFGTFHFNSNEPGLIGIAVTFVLGLVLGALRLRGGGLLAPYVLHFAMDIGVWTLGMRQLGS